MSNPSKEAGDPAQLSSASSLFWGTATACAIGTLYYLLNFAPAVTDWWLTFHPITQHVRAPYDAGIHYAYPPWTAIFLWPFGTIDIDLARGLIGALTVMICAFTIQSLGGKLYAFLFTFLSVPFFQLVINGQIDALPILGLGLLALESTWSSYLGVWFVAAKPQIFVFAIPIYWWNFKQRWPLLGITAGLGLVTLIIWWMWPLDMLEMARQLYTGRDTSLYPWGIPIGLGLFAYAWLQKDGAWAAVATFFFTPYFPPYSLTGVFLVAYCRLPRSWSIALFVLNWIIGIYYLTTPLPA